MVEEGAHFRLDMLPARHDELDRRGRRLPVAHHPHQCAGRYVRRDLIGQGARQAPAACEAYRQAQRILAAAKTLPEEYQQLLTKVSAKITACTS